MKHLFGRQAFVELLISEGITHLFGNPGTTATALSRPFSGSVQADRLFPPARAANHLLQVLEGLTAADSGGFWAWDGQAIPW